MEGVVLYRALVRFVLWVFFPSALTCLPSGFSSAWWCLPKRSALLQSFSQWILWLPWSPFTPAVSLLRSCSPSVWGWRVKVWSCMSDTSFSFCQVLKSQQVNKHLWQQRPGNMLKCLLANDMFLEWFLQCKDFICHFRKFKHTFHVLEHLDMNQNTDSSLKKTITEKHSLELWLTQMVIKNKL